MSSGLSKSTGDLLNKMKVLEKIKNTMSKNMKLSLRFIMIYLCFNTQKLVSVPLRRGSKKSRKNINNALSSEYLRGIFLHSLSELGDQLAVYTAMFNASSTENLSLYIYYPVRPFRYRHQFLNITLSFYSA